MRESWRKEEKMHEFAKTSETIATQRFHGQNGVITFDFDHEQRALPV